MVLNKFRKWISENLLTFLIITCTALGLFVGFLVKSFWQISPLWLSYIGLPGILLTRAFMMVIVPLIVVSLSLSIATTKQGENWRLITLTAVLFLSFSTYSSILGLTMMSVIKPGVQDPNRENINHQMDTKLSLNSNKIITSQEDAIYDIVLNMIPDNIITAAFMQQYTALVPLNESDSTLGYKKETKHVFRANMLGLCVFSLILGFAILSLDSKAEHVKNLLIETNTIVMHIMMLFMRLMPIAMFFWMFVEAIKMKSPEKVMLNLLWFIVTASVSFAIHLLLVLPTIYFLIVRKNPFKFYANIMPAFIVAFGATSSAIALPYTIRCMEENNMLNPRVSKFVLPLGMTAHMNGSAMYYPMVALFVAQMHGISIGWQTLITLCLFAVMMSMAFPGAPFGSSTLVYFISFCSVIGIGNPLDILAYTMSFDWIMERVRTATNITGDCFVAAIIEKLLSKRLSRE